MKRIFALCFLLCLSFAVARPVAVWAGESKDDFPNDFDKYLPEETDSAADELESSLSEDETFGGEYNEDEISDNEEAESEPFMEDSLTQPVLEEAIIEPYTATPLAQNSESQNVATTRQELEAWIKANSKTGGTVELGDQIEINSDLIMLASAAITIDTKEYGLVIDGGIPYLINIFIIGEGVEMPIVDVFNMGVMWTGNWSNYLRLLNITAYGKDGIGGTALRVSGKESGGLYDLDLVEYEPGKISSTGENAIGIEFMDEFHAYGFDIEVSGNNSAAIYMKEGGGVHLSCISGTVKSDIGKPLINTCITSPDELLDDADYFQMSVRDYDIYLPVKQNTTYAEVKRNIDREYSKIPFDTGDTGCQFNSWYALWDDGAISDIDFGTLGSTEITGSFADNFSPWFSNVFELPEFISKLAIDVRNPDIPCITGFQLYNQENVVKGINITFWEIDESLYDSSILWCSNDGGESWLELNESDGIVWNEDRRTSVFIPIDLIMDGMLFQIETPDTGESNILILNYSDGEWKASRGGDRSGADGIVKAKPGDDLGDDDDDKNDDDDKTGEDDGNTPGTDTPGTTPDPITPDPSENDDEDFNDDYGHGYDNNSYNSNIGNVKKEESASILMETSEVIVNTEVLTQTQMITEQITPQAEASQVLQHLDLPVINIDEAEVIAEEPAYEQQPILKKIEKQASDITEENPTNEAVTETVSVIYAASDKPLSEEKKRESIEAAAFTEGKTEMSNQPALISEVIEIKDDSKSKNISYATAFLGGTAIVSSAGLIVLNFRRSRR